MPANQLGDFPFIRIEPPPFGPAEVIVIESAPGVDGHAYWKLGKKGEPQVIRTIVDCPSIGAAMVQFAAYQAAVDAAERLALIYAGLEVTDWKYQPLAVRQIDIRPQAGSVGGVVGGNAGALLLAEWVIVPETVVAEAEA